MQDLLQLPLQLQATLVAGYLGYIVLKRDHRKTEKSIDMWLLILVLGLPTAIILQLTSSEWAYASVLLSPVLAFVWVKWGASPWAQFLYQNNVSHSLNEGDVWKTLSSTKNVAVTQINLFHKNGKQYLCEGTVLFNGEPFAPFIMDTDGIAFYVTHVKPVNGEWEAMPDVKLSPQGSMITYFPRADIEFLDMRYTRHIT